MNDLIGVVEGDKLEDEKVGRKETGRMAVVGRLELVVGN